MRKRNMAWAAGVAAAMGFGVAGNAAIVITEIWSGVAGPDHTSDWFELTNTGDAAVDPSTWFYDDESADPTEDSPLTGVSSIAPGESVVFLASWEDVTDVLDEAIASFRTVWGLGESVQVGSVTGGAGLGSGGDVVNIFDGNTAGAALLASQAYLFSDFASFVWNPVTKSWNDELAVAGRFGAYESLVTGGTDDLPAIGSPGLVPEPGALALMGIGGLMLIGRRR